MVHDTRSSRAIPSALILLILFLALSGCGDHKDRWSVFGEAPHDAFGTKVAPAGDVNGDHFADVAVWAPGHGNAAGKVYVFLGSPQGLSTTPAWAVQGERDNDQYGHSFGTVGDVNGDGFGDFIAAAQGYDGPKGKDMGKAYLYQGSAQGLGSKPIWTRVGRDPSELLGDCSGPAGDIDRDGLSDVVVGAYGCHGFRGRAYVFHGSKKGGLSPAPIWMAEGERDDDWYGYSVASCGDIQGQGYPSLVIGGKQHPNGKLTHAGKVYVYYGSKNGFSKTPSWTAQGETEGELFGWRALPTGDIQGTGHTGLIVSGYMYGRGDQHYNGKVYVYYGSARGLPAVPSWTFEGEASSSLFGYTIASGDFDGDGHSDILVGAPNWKNGRGKIYLFRGHAEGLSKEPDWTLEGQEAQERFGSYLCNAGDVNGDGLKDALVGAPDSSQKAERSGKVYLFYGGKDGKLLPYPR